MAITCGDCRWYEPGIGDGLPGRCRGGGVAIKVWPDDAACRAILALMKAEQERGEVREALELSKLAEVKRLARSLARAGECPWWSSGECELHNGVSRPEGSER